MGIEPAPTYLMRTKGHNLIAQSLAELAELIECAYDDEDHVELLVAYYPAERPLQQGDLDDVIASLRTNC